MLNFTCCDSVQSLFAREHAELLRGIRRGFEREALRVDAQGFLARTPHPHALGAKLTHPWITTDYAEALLEFITPPSSELDGPLAFLDDLHRYTARHLGDELLWAGSMPCRIGTDADIAIADYGPSAAGQVKNVYRLGLGLRYGRAMQTIAGAHYNWSLPTTFWQALHSCCGQPGQTLRDFIDERLFGLIRNFLRDAWLVPYLFGASPALCRSFLQGRPSDLHTLGEGTLYGPWATSLRMSDLGYQNHAQDKLGIGFDSLAAYCHGLESAIRTPDPYYHELGVQKDGQWQQISDSILQLEAEYYAPMRPKRSASVRPAKALATLGVEYLEMRLFDINPFEPLGIAPEQVLFADVMLLTCLMRASPPISAREQGENDENKRRVVSRGRQPGLQLRVHNQDASLRDQAHRLFDQMQAFAQMLDSAYGHTRHSQTLQALRQRIDDPECTPSAQVLAAIQAHGSYFEFAFERSRQHTQALRQAELPAATAQRLTDSVAQSHAELARLNAQPQPRFEDYLADYFAP
ncbi:MAG: glutamate--cysteine ligase [Rhodoferax sp.]